MNIKANPANICSVCGKVLKPPYDRVYKHGTKQNCEDCENQRKQKTAQSKKTVETVTEEQEAKKELYTLIRRVYQVSEVPDRWIYQVDRLIKDGKTYAGLTYTLNYAVNYLGIQVDSTYGISGLIEMFYEEAAKNYAKEEEIRSRNEVFNHNSETIKIKMRAPKTTKWKPTSSIEDL